MERDVKPESITAYAYRTSEIVSRGSVVTLSPFPVTPEFQAYLRLLAEGIDKSIWFSELVVLPTPSGMEVSLKTSPSFIVAQVKMLAPEWDTDPSQQIRDAIIVDTPKRLELSVVTSIPKSPISREITTNENLRPLYYSFEDMAIFLRTNAFIRDLQKHIIVRG